MGTRAPRHLVRQTRLPTGFFSCIPKYAWWIHQFLLGNYATPRYSNELWHSQYIWLVYLFVWGNLFKFPRFCRRVSPPTFSPICASPRGDFPFHMKSIPKQLKMNYMKGPVKRWQLLWTDANFYETMISPTKLLCWQNQEKRSWPKHSNI